MIRLSGVVLLVVLSLTTALGQLASTEKQARKSMEKKRWPKARAYLDKSLRKDPVNPGAQFVYARFFFHPGNPDFDVDSAYTRLGRAGRALGLIEKKAKDRLRKAGVDTLAILRFREKIDSAAFDRARRINTEAIFQDFLDRFTYASQRDSAVILRDGAAYSDALKSNTYQGFLSFLNKYPNSIHAQEANANYQRLLFEDRTRDQRLASYRSFLQDYPETPYRWVVEKNIFELSTGSGEVATFIQFIREFPHSSFSSRAKGIIFHLIDDTQYAQMAALLGDSLRNLKALNEPMLIPVLKDKRFDFMTASGTVLLKANALSIPDEYKCGGNLMEDLLIADGQLRSRNGAVVYSEVFESVDDLGAGVVLITKDDCASVVHKSGSVIAPCVDDARILAGRLVATKQGSSWTFKTLTGRKIEGLEVDNAETVDNVIVLKRENKLAAVLPSTLAQLVDGNTANISWQFDEVKAWGDNRIWTRTENIEQLLGYTLNPVIAAAPQKLIKTPFGLRANTDKGITLYYNDGRRIGDYIDVRIHTPWTLVKTDSVWRILDIPSANPYPPRLDSISFVGQFLKSARSDSSLIYFSPRTRLPVSSSWRTTFIAGKDSSGYLLVQTDKRLTKVYGPGGQLMFTGDFETVQYAGEGYFIVSKKEKKGLVSSAGKQVLPMEYDAIGAVKNSVVTLLRGMRFGAFNIKQKKLIKPQFDKNLVIYSPGVLAVFQKERYGFMGWDGKPLSEPMFDEILHWTDTLALVRKGSYWQIFDVARNRVREDAIQQINYLRNTPDEKLAIVKQDNAFGVLSSRKHYIIPPTFTYLRNVGSADSPVYLTEKHVEEASIFVVIYYDENARMLLRQVYEEDDYRRIICPD